MKLLSLMAVSLLFSSCVTWKRDIGNDPQFAKSVGRRGTLKQSETLCIIPNENNSYYQPAFTPYCFGLPEKLSFLKKIESLPRGSEVKIIAIKRERDSFQHLWDYAILEVYSPKLGKNVKVEELLGLSGKGTDSLLRKLNYIAWRN